MQHHPLSNDELTTEAVAVVLIFACSIAISLAIHHFGGMMGGLIAGLPTFNLIDSMATLLSLRSKLISKTLLSSAYQSIFLIFPIGMALNAGFLYLWSILPPIVSNRFKKLSKTGVALVISFFLSTAWVIAAIILVYLLSLIHGIGNLNENLDLLQKDQKKMESNLSGAKYLFLPASLAFIGTITIAFYLSLSPRSAPRGTRILNIKIALIRATLAALVRVFAFTASHSHSVPSLLVGILFTLPLGIGFTASTMSVSRGHLALLGTIPSILLTQITGSLYHIMLAILLVKMELFHSIMISFIVSSVIVCIPGLLFLRSRRKMCAKHDLLQQNRKAHQDLLTINNPNLEVLQAGNMAVEARGKKYTGDPKSSNKNTNRQVKFAG